MEPQLRGLIEKLIDEGLRPERLIDLYKSLEDFSPLIESKEDTLFGYFIGNVYGHLFYFTQLLYHREPTDKERAFLTLIIVERAKEIRSKISNLSKES